MTPQELKNSILQLAIQGKLVEQRSEEGTAEELFAQIQAKKQQLIAQKKIKKERPLPEIIDEEKPFDIPENWKWVRIGEIFGLQAGKNITSANIYEEESRENPYRCYGGNGVRGFVSTYNREGHFALIGRQGALCGNINLAKEKFYATEHAVVVEQYNMTDVLWCGWFLKALNLNQYATATAQPGLAVANIVKVLIPLPPFAEQKRIVAKIEELLPYIDCYEQAWSKLEQFNSRFPEDMKKSLLQYAIQGKLVEQRSEEGTAEELFAQIQEEKQRLIAKKKIKKEKLLPEITEDEKPFDIPESWKWVRLRELCDSDISYGIIKLGNEDCNGVKVLRCSDVKENTIIPDRIRTVAPELSEQYARTVLRGGEIVINVRGTLGGCAVVPESMSGFNVAREVAVIRQNQFVDAQYVVYILITRYFQSYMFHGLRGIAYKGLNMGTLAQFPVPLPPLAEQKRIVEKLEQLLPLCERLK